METTIFQKPQQGVKIGETERRISTISGAALVGAALFSPGRLRGLLLLTGGAMLVRGLTGYSLFYRILNINPSQDRLENGIRVERSMTILKPVEEVYAYWRNLENLPRFMENLQQVQVQGNQSHWVAEAPLGRSVEWDAVIDEEQPNQKLSWHSISGSQIENTGVVLFQPAPGNRGAEVHVHLEYRAPGGEMGAALAKILGEEPDRQILGDLRRFKQIMETGEVITVKGQTSGREATE